MKIGIFDSGIGGLSVLHLLGLQRLCSHHRVVHLPLGGAGQAASVLILPRESA